MAPLDRRRPRHSRLTVARSYSTMPKSGKVRHLRLPTALVPILRSWRQHCPQSPDGSVLPLGLSWSRTGGVQAMLGLPKLMAEVGLRARSSPMANPSPHLREPLHDGRREYPDAIQDPRTQRLASDAPVRPPGAGLPWRRDGQGEFLIARRTD